jgi:hypothetical protein
MPSSTLRRASHDPRQETGLVASVVAGPLVWLTLLEVNYVLTYVACEQRSDWMLHVASIVALVLVGLAGLVAWRARTAGPTDAPTVSQDEIAELRTRFLANAGVLMCAWFSVVIIATEIPVIVYRPCQ